MWFRITNLDSCVWNQWISSNFAWPVWRRRQYVDDVIPPIVHHFRPIALLYRWHSVMVRIWKYVKYINACLIDEHPPATLTWHTCTRHWRSVTDRKPLLVRSTHAIEVWHSRIHDRVSTVGNVPFRDPRPWLAHQLYRRPVFVGSTEPIQHFDPNHCNDKTNIDEMLVFNSICLW